MNVNHDEFRHRFRELLCILTDALVILQASKQGLFEALTKRLLSLGNHDDEEGRLVRLTVSQLLADQARSDGNLQEALRLYENALAFGDKRTVRYYIDLGGLVHVLFDMGEYSSGFDRIAGGILTGLSNEAEGEDRFIIRILALIRAWQSAKLDPQHLQGPFSEAIRMFIRRYQILSENQFDERWEKDPFEVLSFLESYKDQILEARKKKDS